jgi:hypothetical protein
MNSNRADPPHPPRGWLKKLLPYLTLTALAFALGGTALTLLLPSQILKPDALRAQALVERSYQEMIDVALLRFPGETTADITKEECWTKGKSICIYGWYAEWKGAVYLMSFTYAAEAEDRQGRLRGWWWEVDVGKEEVRPVWRAPELMKRYHLEETDEFRSEALPDRPIPAPLLKIP